MDLIRIARALRRYWRVGAIVMVCGIGLGIYTFVRTETVYSSDSIIFVTERGFPWGRTIIEPVDPQSPQTGERFASGERFTELASLYAQLAGSDPVREEVAQNGEIDGDVFAEVVVNTNVQNSSALPLVRIRALTSSPAGAVDLARRWTDAFRDYISQRQQREKVPDYEVVLLELVRAPTLDRVAVVQPRSLTRPVAIVLAGAILALGLVSLLDSARQKGILSTATRWRNGQQPQLDEIEVREADHGAAEAEGPWATR